MGKGLPLIYFLITFQLLVFSGAVTLKINLDSKFPQGEQLKCRSLNGIQESSTKLLNC